jgi:homoserine dehydrogenase
MGDVVMAARNRVRVAAGRASPSTQAAHRADRAIPTRYYVNMNVKISRAYCPLSQRNSAATRSASPRSARGDDRHGGRAVRRRIVVVTHESTDAALSETVEALAELDVVQKINSVLRMEGATA